jgi:hypothetical protein
MAFAMPSSAGLKSNEEVVVLEEPLAHPAEVLVCRTVVEEMGTRRRG